MLRILPVLSVVAIAFAPEPIMLVIVALPSISVAALPIFTDEALLNVHTADVTEEFCRSTPYGAMLRIIVFATAVVLTPTTVARIVAVAKEAPT